ncbi:MAG: hypothetical protein AAB590_00275 [Patescibacteria group bacterium]
MCAKMGISDFFGCVIPEKLVLDGLAIEAKLDGTAIRDLIPERGRALYAERAVILDGNEHPRCLVMVSVTEEICEGHMPGAPILPLALGGWMLSQAGEILVAYTSRQAGENGTVPIVYKVGAVQSKSRDFLIPGDCLILEAELVNQRLALREVNTTAWIAGGNQVVAMPDVLYTTIDLDQLKRRVCEQLERRKCDAS